MDGIGGDQIPLLRASRQCVTTVDVMQVRAWIIDHIVVPLGELPCSSGDRRGDLEQVEVLEALEVQQRASCHSCPESDHQGALDLPVQESWYVPEEQLQT